MDQIQCHIVQLVRSRFALLVNVPLKDHKVCLRLRKRQYFGKLTISQLDEPLGHTVTVQEKKISLLL